MFFKISNSIKQYFLWKLKPINRGKAMNLNIYGFNWVFRENKRNIYKYLQNIIPDKYLHIPNVNRNVNTKQLHVITFACLRIFVTGITCLMSFCFSISPTCFHTMSIVRQMCFSMKIPFQITLWLPQEKL